MRGFLYFSCVLTGVLSGGALGYAFGSAFIGGGWGRWISAALGAAVLTYFLLKLGRRLIKLTHE